MSEPLIKKVLRTRQVQKHDTEANWNIIAYDFVPLKGELIIYDPDETHNYSRYKIGDGETLVFNLPFASYSVHEINVKELSLLEKIARAQNEAENSLKHITTTIHGGLKVTHVNSQINNIDIDDDVTFVLESGKSKIKKG